uniref:ABC transporter ATP-binding protein n=1 Tax=candidate division WOR-3 bacterium TaxID=2052148 RepID=A0A7V3KMV3_UNCW3
MSEFTLVLENIHKSYKTPVETIHVLKGTNLKVPKGERFIITGPSGSGKSTLLHIAGLLDMPDEGFIYLNGEKINKKSDPELSKLRAKHIGFVFQFHHLLPDFSILDNVALPLIINGEKPKEARKRALQVLERLNIANIHYKRPSEVSGGEQQRAAIARAIVGNPDLLLLDEPTGNLDKQNTLELMEILKELNEELGITIIMVTHNLNLISYFTRHYALSDGILIEE